MHEFSLVKKEVERVKGKLGDRKVKKVVFFLGRLAHGNPDSIRQAFKLAVLKTPLSCAKLEVVTVEPRLKCSSCGNIFGVSPGMSISCLKCNSNTNELISGNECYIDSVEVAD